MPPEDEAETEGQGQGQIKFWGENPLTVGLPPAPVSSLQARLNPIAENEQVSPAAPHQSNLLLPKEPGWQYGTLLPFRAEAPEAFKMPSEYPGGWPEFIANHLAIPDMVRDPINQLASMVDREKYRLSGKMVVSEDPNENMDRPGTGADLAAMLDGLMLAPVPKGAVGVFGGPLARTAKHDLLARAKWLEQELPKLPGNEGIGQTELGNKIWQDTKALGQGWFKDKDGHWKFEIPDSSAKWTDQVERVNPYSTGLLSDWIGFSGKRRLGDYLDHPELYAAYPELAETPLTSAGWAQLNGTKGVVFSNGDIGLSAASPKDALSTSVHELDHKIQRTEGFARGGTPEEFLPPGFDVQLKQTSDMLDAAQKMLNEAGVNYITLNNALQKLADRKPLMRYEQKAWEDAKAAGLLEPYIDVLGKGAEVNAIHQKAWEQYQKLGGEVSARNSQERLAQGDYESHPHATTGYPPGTQIIRFDNGVSGVPVGHDPFLPVQMSTNKDLFDLAKKLGVDINSIPALRELAKLQDFHSELTNGIKAQAALRYAIANKLHETGVLPYAIGARFSTEHSRKTGAAPWRVKDYYINGKDPNKYGYFVERGEGENYESSLTLASHPSAKTWQELTGPKLVPVDHDPFLTLKE